MPSSSRSYSLFGQVTEGTDVVDAIGKPGASGQAGTPKEAVVMKTVKITETKP